MVLNQNLGIDRTVVLPGAITALSLGGANLYVATAASTQLTSINRMTGQVTKIALPVVPLDLRCTATNCTVLTATGGTKVVTFTFASKKVTNTVQLPSWVTKMTVLGTTIVAYGPGSLTALRIDVSTRNIASLSFGEEVLKVGGSGAVATVVTAHRVTLVNLVPWTKKKTTEFVTAVKAISVDGVTVFAGDAASPFVRVVVAA
jgi:hypothetical protein